MNAGRPVRRHITNCHHSTQLAETSQTHRPTEIAGVRVGHMNIQFALSRDIRLTGLAPLAWTVHMHTGLASSARVCPSCR